VSVSYTYINVEVRTYTYHHGNVNMSTSHPFYFQEYVGGRLFNSPSSKTLSGVTTFGIMLCSILPMMVNTEWR